jgi:DNA-binding LytR/AlgR family response regulator
MRIHRSHIINKDEVKSLYGNMVEIGDKKILIGKTYKEQVLAEIFK